MIEIAFVALGSNLGDRAAHLATARAGIDALPSTHVADASTVEETAPLGALAQPAYLNQMLRVRTALEPADLLAATQAIEAAAGRTRDGSARWGSRTLDVDVVLFGTRRVCTDSLEIPHPGLAHRDFWQRELAELGVDWRAALSAANATTAPAVSTHDAVGTHA